MAETVYETDYDRGGIEYKITVEKEGGAFWGTWCCTSCNHKGSSSAKCDTIEDAVRLAENNTGGHHFTAHRGAD